MGELRNLQSTYYRFFKEAGSAMAVTDKTGTLAAANDRFRKLAASLSQTQVEIAGDSARLNNILDFLPAQDATRFSNLLSALANGETERMDFKSPYYDREGKVHWFKVHAWKMSTDSRVDLSGRGPLIGIIMNDETVEKEAEEKLRENMRIAEEAMEAKSRFLAAMSHEIRTPIQTITGMAELLEDTSLNDEQAEYAQQIKFAADILLSLVNDILDYSKIEAGKMELEQIPFSPGKTIEDAARMLSLEAGGKGLSLVTQIPAEARAPVLGDGGKFRQVLINLIKNAVKFTANGTITVSAAFTLGASARHITVAVADTGIGISEEARERLFTTFMQADSSHTRRFGGTGLGLAISRSMVELMGGTIEMLPNEGGGSLFRFTVPVGETAACPAEAEPRIPTEERIQAEERMAEMRARTQAPPDFVVPADIVPPRGPDPAGPVLIVEDHPVNRKLFSMIMEKLGIETVSAGDGVEALELAAAHPVSLVFMDIQMPRMNGWEAARELRRRGFTRPLIAVTAGVHAGELQQCREAGFDDILFKPFKRPGIEAMYRKWSAGIQPGAGTFSSPVSGEEKKPVVFCAGELLDTFMDNEESAKSLLVRFIERSSRDLVLLGDLLRRRDWDEAYRIVHTIKGSSMTLSGMELGMAALRLETALRERPGETAGLDALTGPLTEAFDRFRAAAGEYVR